MGEEEIGEAAVQLLGSAISYENLGRYFSSYLFAARWGLTELAESLRIANGL